MKNKTIMIVAVLLAACKLQAGAQNCQYGTLDFLNPRIEFSLGLGDGVYTEVCPSLGMEFTERSEIGIGAVANRSQLGDMLGNYGAFISYRYSFHPEKLSHPFLLYRGGYTWMNDREYQEHDCHGYIGHFHEWRLGYTINIREMKLDLGIGCTKKRWREPDDCWNDRFSTFTVGFWF